MSSRYPLALGALSRRIKGAEREFTARRENAHHAATLTTSEHEAAMLRGKAAAYQEAVETFAALQNGRRLPRRVWGNSSRSRRRAPLPPPRYAALPDPVVPTNG